MFRLISAGLLAGLVLVSGCIPPESPDAAAAAIQAEQVTHDRYADLCRAAGGVPDKRVDERKLSTGTYYVVTCRNCILPSGEFQARLETAAKPKLEQSK